MTDIAKPDLRPARPDFRPDHAPSARAIPYKHWKTRLGRSHRSKPGKERLAAAIDKTRAILGVPDDYRIGIVPALTPAPMKWPCGPCWARGLDILGWESFGKGWITDAVKHLKLGDIRVMEADYGALPDLGEVAFTRDVAFTWNGTTSACACQMAIGLP